MSAAAIAAMVVCIEEDRRRRQMMEEDDDILLGDFSPWSYIFGCAALIVLSGALLWITFC